MHNLLVYEPFTGYPNLDPRGSFSKQEISMALTFAKKVAGVAPAQSPTQSEGSAPKEPPKVVSGGVSFLKRGAAAKAVAAEEEAKAEERRAAANRMRRYYMDNNADTQITFLDGKLDAEGVLDIPRFYEHIIQVGGDWKNFVCTAEIDTGDPCPICALNTDQSRRSLVGVMTIIDHSKYTVKKGPNAGKVYTNQRKLFVAKETTLKQLNKLAAKPERNGLAGCTFDVSRGPENTNAPRVGSTFDFVTKHKTLASIAEKYGLQVEECVPAQYDGDDGEIVYLSPKKLLELGIGKAHGGVGYEKGVNASGEL